MQVSSATSLPRAERPFFHKREDLDDLQSMSSVAFARGDFSVGRYRRDRPGLGVTTPNPISPMYMAVVILRSRPPHVGWCEGRTVEMPALETGSLACLDLRQSWSMDLADPFDSMHVFIPLAAFDDIATERRLSRVEHLDCPPMTGPPDETMLHLARALNHALASPSEASALFADHIFIAMTVHLAVTYGGVDRRAAGNLGACRPPTLSIAQERLVKESLLSDLTSDPGLAELASLCRMSRSYFAEAFKQTTGLPPHRWLLLHRVRRARELLKLTRMPISEVALECGFADQSHLTRVFSRLFQMGPAAWRRQWSE